MTEEGDHLIQLAEQDPQACLETCRAILSMNAPESRAADAHRAQGIAHRSLGEVEDSIRELQLAREQYLGVGDDEAEAESAISLAASVAMSGQLGEAVDSLEPLLGHERSSVRAHAQVQKAGLIARSGDLHGAMSLYEVAQPVLEASKDLRWLALLHSTRGLVQTYLSEFEAAESDLRTARDLFLGLDRVSSAAEMLHNLGFVAVQSGDIARGLSLLVEAEDAFKEAGLPIEAISSDRSFAYMLAGLPGRAFEVAEVAARRFGAQARELERVEALYLAARAALADGNPESAFQVADEAARSAAGQNRASWALMASVVREEASLRAGMPGDVPELVELAQAFSAGDNPSGEMHALALAALRSLEQEDMSGAAESLAAIEQRDDAPPELSVELLVAVARAKLMLVEGRREPAIEVLKQAADLVDRHRILLSATEARAGVSLLTDEIADLGLRAIHGDGTSVMSWTERFRGASLRIAPVVKSRDTELASALAELRGTVRDLDQQTLAGEDTREIAIETRRLESRIRDLSMARELDPGISSPVHTAADVVEDLESRLMLYIYDVADRTYAEVVSSGSFQLFEIEAADHLRLLSYHMAAGLRREFMLRNREGSSRPSRVHETIAELAGHFLGPLVGARSEVIVVPPPDLASLPWNAMASAIDPGLVVVVSPSAGLWLQAHRRAGRHDPLGVVAGPNLEYAAIEAEKVAGFYEGPVNVLTGDHATVDSVAEAMASCGSLHAVAHTQLRHDNPMFSALELADGFLNLYDLERLNSVPETVVLSACDSAHGNVVGGHEMYGLTSVLLNRGARSIIATVAPIPDSNESVEAVGRIHSGLHANSTAAAAIQQAQSEAETSSVDPSLAFVAYGA